MVFAVAFYDVVKAFHIMAVVAAFGLPLAYPLMLPYVQRRHPEALAGVHNVQLWLNRRVTGIGTAAILVFGAIMATDRDLWSEVWVTVPLIIIFVIGGVGGALINPAVAKLGELAARDVTRAGAPDETVGFSDEYDAVYRSYIRYEILLGALVLLAIFFMAAKP